jgi:molecular chaperone DnaK
VPFDFDLNGILQVSAVDRGSGKQAGVRLSAARARLSSAEIISSRASLDELAAADLDDLEDEDLEDEDDGAPALPAFAPRTSSLETLALLARARRAVSRASGDTTALQSTITDLSDAIDRNDDGAIATLSDDLLDLLYDLDDE